MPTLRRESAGSLQPKTLLESENPYESRRLTVEYDGVTTAAYLHDATSTVAATWIANHVPAPASTDVDRIESGQAPIMPASHTKLPEGRPPFEPGTLEPLWFEEGDGVAVLENGKLLAVIPGWSDASRGMPGYSRDIVGQTPFGWSLDDAMEGLRPAERAGPGLLEVAPPRAVLGRVPAGGAGPPARPAGRGRPLLGRVRGQAADGRDFGAAADRGPALQRAVHGRHELPADAGGGAAGPGSGSVRADRAGPGHHHAARAGGPGVPVAGPLPVARGHLVRSWSQRALVPRAVDVPARERLRGGAAAGRPGRPARSRAAQPVRLLVRRRPGALAVGGPHHRAGTPDRQGRRLGQPHHPARGGRPQLDRRRPPPRPGRRRRAGLIVIWPPGRWPTAGPGRPRGSG